MIGLAGNLAVIGVMVMDRRTRFLMVILLMVVMIFLASVVTFYLGKG